MPLPANDVWIVIAAYREQTRLGETLRRLLAEGYTNVVVVDDGSPDNTGNAAISYPVWVLRHTLNLGQGAALQTGIEFALEKGAEIVVTFDADGQHDPTEIARLIAPVRAGAAQLALGSRFLGATVNLPFTRRLVLKGGVVFTRLFSNVKVTDTHNGFRAMNRDVASKLKLTQNRMAHASEVHDRIRERGWKFVEVPVTIRYTAETLAKGQSSWNAFKIVVQLMLGRLVK